MIDQSLGLALLSGLLAFAVCYWAIPPIIRLSLVKRLYDEPDERKLHSRRIGALGGIPIFGAFLFSFVLFSAGLDYPQQNSILAAYLILFSMGVKDDLFPLSPSKKILGQFLAAALVVFVGDVRMESFYGLFAIGELPYALSAIWSIVLFLMLINSFNFIDGINGLSSGLGILTLSIFAYWFHRMNEPLFLTLCLSYTGALLGFFPYNYRKEAKIFMGDSGSMILGFNLAVITVFFIQKSVVAVPNFFYAIGSAVYAFALLIVPVFDTLRVVVLRIGSGRSPFSADRNHIHHVLLDLGLSHRQSTAILIGVALGFALLASLLKDIVLPKFQLILYTVLAALLSQIPSAIRNRQTALSR
jgi:UDP-N-acetylmuramyl pentapeptide phosphotransferase/UDP-N-acetylglucosamine-1-phosphate transferase